jgi:hypothetical protein
MVQVLLPEGDHLVAVATFLSLEFLTLHTSKHTATSKNSKLAQDKQEQTLENTERMGKTL